MMAGAGRLSSCVERRLCALFAAAVLAAVPTGGMLIATKVFAAESAAPAPLAQEKLDSLLAPIALYPDQLLTQTLMAATYPLDVVSAARFIEQNKSLQGEALDKAVAEKKWDPSVQSLTAYPQVLLMMSEQLDWTQELGDAFLADEKRVMDTVQRLRQKAYAEGNLKSNEQQKVVKQETVIIVEPATPQVVYVPTYNPTVVYGTWWAPAYPPYYYPPPPYYYPPGAVAAAGVIGFGIGVAVANNHWGWSHADWHGGDVDIDVNRNNTFVNNNPEFKNKVKNGNWQHNPSQRKGVAYGDASTRERYNKVDRNAVSSRRETRGLDSSRARGDSSQYARNGNRAQQQPSRSGGAGDTRRDSSTQRDKMPRDSSRRTSDGSRYSDTRPSFDSRQSRQQTQDFSRRGASSRESMGGGRSRGGGGRRR